MRLKLIWFIGLCGILTAIWPCRTEASLQHRTIYSRTYDTRKIAVPPSLFSRSGKIFVSTALVDDSATLRIWSTRSGKLIRSFVIPDLQYFALSPDSGTLALIIGQRGRRGLNKAFSVQLRDRSSGKVLRTFVKVGAVEAAFYTLAFSPDGKFLAAGSGDGLVRVWSVTTGRRFATLRQGGFVGSLAFAPNGKTLAALSNGYKSGIRLWDVKSKKLLRSASADANNMMLLFSPDGKHLVVNGSGRRVQFYSVSNFKVERQLPASQDWRQGNSTPQVALSSSGRYIVFTREGYITVRDARFPKRVKARYPIGPDTGPITNGVLTLHFALSGREIRWATYTYKGGTYTLKIWHASF